jgi:glycosyltransferase involved in cell wall biosynthesis
MSDAPTHVCLIAEGSYPYVTGGVGKWTQDLISSMPEVEFTVVALWPTPESSGPPRYPLPKNVRELRHVYLFPDAPGLGPGDPEAVERFAGFHGSLMKGEAVPLEGILRGMGEGRPASTRRNWDLICRMYETHAPPGTSFQDFVWTWDATYRPLLRAVEARLPDASVIHCISTGYAGLVGAAHRLRTRAPLVTTEHGLYTKERAQELWDADWIPGEPQARARRGTNFFKDWWYRMFLSFEKTAYAHSDCVIALFEENRRYQISHDAPPERARVIPNGVDLAIFEEVRRKRRPREQVHVGLVGRVVPIKDIKTFLMACQAVAQRVPPSRLRISVIGPTEEDADYAAGCREMAEVLGLSELVTFTGKVDARRYYETIDIVVLTSLSEGQPLTLLEALACGIPVVATDVGACREVLEGGTAEDRALGPAGIVTLPADPPETARAIAELATDPARRRAMGEAGRRRVQKYYRLEQVREAYLNLYRSLDHGRR